MVDSIQSQVRSDVVAIESAPRPTPTPVRVPFKQILARVGIGAAQTAMTSLPGGPMVATAIRGPLSVSPGIGAQVNAFGGPGAAPAVSTAPEGPGAVGTSALGAGDPQSALAQSQANEMQMLVLQTQVAAQQNSFTVMSNILKTESDTEKNAINNIK
jgi:hypothetical protein